MSRDGNSFDFDGEPVQLGEFVWYPQEFDLPDTVSLDTRAFIVAFHAADDHTLADWKHAGALQTLQDETAPVGHATPDEEPAEVDADFIETSLAAWEIRYIPDRMDTPHIEYAGGLYSPSESTDAYLRNRFAQPTASPALNRARFVRTSQQQEYMEAFVESDEIEAKELRQKFTAFAVAKTIVAVARTLANSALTEREFLAYHLGASYSPDAAADLMTELLGADQTGGAVRKYQSRVDEKLKRAATTIDVAQPPVANRVEDLPALEARDASPLDSDTKTNMLHALHRHLHTSPRSHQETKTWTVVDGCTLSFTVDPVSIQGRLYYECGALPRPVVVDELHYEHENVVQKSRGQEITGFRELSSRHAALIKDIVDVISEIVPVRPEFLSSPPDAQALATYESGNEGGGVVSFELHAEFPEVPQPLGGLPKQRDV